MIFLFTIYPSMCSMGGETLRCLKTSDDLEGAKQFYWLKADYSVNCQELWDSGFVAVDIFFMILYPVGIPVYFYWLMFEWKDELMDRAYSRPSDPRQFFVFENLRCTIRKSEILNIDE